MSGGQWALRSGRPESQKEEASAVRITAAPIKEQGQTFVVVLVKDRVIHEPSGREQIARVSQRFFGARAALMGERELRTWGPRDIVAWLEGVPVEQLPWREFTVS
jgi:hypothetical protein